MYSNLTNNFTENKKSSREIGLYIHIPFCRSKCYYCDFNSYAGKEAIAASYFNCLKKELELYHEQIAEYPIKSIFIGGGTPSIVEADLITDLVKYINNEFTIKGNVEISIESNPGTLSIEKLTAYKDCCINRLSIGLQASQNRLLKQLGRIHTVEDYRENILNARKAGFTNINTDLIFGLPGQSLKDWEESLLEVIDCGVEHLSCYSLIIEEGTVLGDCLEAGILEQPDEGLDRDMYHLTIEMLEGAGFKHYEISNFAKAGFECKHNLIYWSAGEYLGIGVGAHSYLESTRFNNTNGVEDYINSINKGIIPKENQQFISNEEAILEYMLLGFRLRRGVSTDAFYDRFNCDLFSIFSDKLDKLIKKGLIENSEKHFYLTEKGLDFANEVFIEFI
jgi:oxygen-independent coproporphyrinogen-3 oxidase